MEVRPSPIHGNGLFATFCYSTCNGARPSVSIRRGTKLGYYTGDVLTLAEVNDGRSQDYVVGLGRGKYLDGNKPDNLLGRVNHSDQPNVRMAIRGTRVTFYAKRDIYEGEELTLNYGYDPKTHDYVFH